MSCAKPAMVKRVSVKVSKVKRRGSSRVQGHSAFENRFPRSSIGCMESAIVHYYITYAATSL